MEHSIKSQGMQHGCNKWTVALAACMCLGCSNGSQVAELNTPKQHLTTFCLCCYMSDVSIMARARCTQPAHPAERRPCRKVTCELHHAAAPTHVHLHTAASPAAVLCSPKHCYSRHKPCPSAAGPQTSLDAFHAHTSTAKQKSSAVPLSAIPTWTAGSWQQCTTARPWRACAPLRLPKPRCSHQPFESSAR